MSVNVMDIPKDIDMGKLGKILKRKRKEMGLRIEDVADSLLSPAMVSLIERGKLTQITSKVEYFCEKLHIDLCNITELENEEDDHEDIIYHQLISAEHLLDLHKLDTDLALKIITNLEITEKHPFYNYLLLLKAKGCIKRGQISKAIPHLRQCIECSPTEDDMNIKATAYSNLALCYYLSNDLEQALTLVKEGLKNFILDGARQYLYYNLQVDEIIYLEKLGRKHEAFYKLQPLFEQKEKLTLDAKLNLYEFYGNTLMEGNTHKACDILSQGLEVARKNNNTHRTVELSVQLGKAYELLQKREIAETYYELALKLEKNLDYKAFLIDAYVARGKIFLQDNDTKQAEIYFLKGLKIGLEYDEKLRLYEVYQSLGTLMVTMNNSQKAIDYFEKGMEIAEHLRMNHLKEKMIVSLIDCYKQIGNHERELYLLTILYETKKGAL